MSIRSLLFGKRSRAGNDVFRKDRAPIRGEACAKEYSFEERILGDHIFLEKGKGPPVVFCSGLYGSIYNFAELGTVLSENYRVIVPYLPMYELPLTECTVPRIAEYLHDFAIALDLQNAVYIGSSMGGGALLHYALRKDHRIRALILCGSSGLSTIPMQKGFFKRKDYAFIKKATGEVFFDASVASDSMVREIFNAIQDYEIVLRSIRFTRSTAKDQLQAELSRIDLPCLLIWGKQDNITPPEVAEKFRTLLPNAELHYIDECGHVPTQEHPAQTLELINEFFKRIDY